MAEISIDFGGATLAAIDRFAPGGEAGRADFARRAAKDEIFRRETERMREAYQRVPDSVEDEGRWTASTSAMR